MKTTDKLFETACRRFLEKADQLKSDESGATAIEYGLIVALIFLAIVASVTTFGSSTSGMYTTISDSITQP